MTAKTVTIADLADIVLPDGMEAHWTYTARRANRAIIRAIEGNVALVQYLRCDNDYCGLVYKMPVAHIVKTYMVEIDASTGNLIFA